MVVPELPHGLEHSSIHILNRSQSSKCLFAVLQVVIHTLPMPTGY